MRKATLKRLKAAVILMDEACGHLRKAHDLEWSRKMKVYEAFCKLGKEELAVCQFLGSFESWLDSWNESLRGFTEKGIIPYRDW